LLNAHNYQLTDRQKIINAEKSDLYDVLAYVAYALAPLTREERASHAKVMNSTQFGGKQQTLLDFVLSQYVNDDIDAGSFEAEPVTTPQISRLAC